MLAGRSAPVWVGLREQLPTKMTNPSLWSQSGAQLLSAFSLSSLRLGRSPVVSFLLFLGHLLLPRTFLEKTSLVTFISKMTSKGIQGWVCWISLFWLLPCTTYVQRRGWSGVGDPTCVCPSIRQTGQQQPCLRMLCTQLQPGC